MASIKAVERQIGQLEGFDVIISQNGRDVRSDRTGIHGYKFKRAAKGDWTVSNWKSRRFSQTYAGFEVEVLDGFHRTVNGNKKLSNVRHSYTEE